MSFHSATFDLLGTRPRVSSKASQEIEEVGQRLRIPLPAAVREWYAGESALRILAEHSNDDPPVPVREFEILSSKWGPVVPIRHENQGVCTWAILLDGSEDPPVYVDVNSEGWDWRLATPRFSSYVYTCVWDYSLVMKGPALVQAQNGLIGPGTLRRLAEAFKQEPTTISWSGSAQYRFSGREHALLLWEAEDQTDWFVGATDEDSLETALRIVWELDQVGNAFYDCSELGAAALARFKADS